MDMLLWVVLVVCVLEGLQQCKGEAGGTLEIANDPVYRWDHTATDCSYSVEENMGRRFLVAPLAELHNSKVVYQAVERGSCKPMNRFLYFDVSSDGYVWDDDLDVENEVIAKFPGFKDGCSEERKEFIAARHNSDSGYSIATDRSYCFLEEPQAVFPGALVDLNKCWLRFDGVFKSFTMIATQLQPVEGRPVYQAYGPSSDFCVAPFKFFMYRKDGVWIFDNDLDYDNGHAAKMENDFSRKPVFEYGCPNRVSWQPIDFVVGVNGDGSFQYKPVGHLTNHTTLQPKLFNFCQLVTCDNSYCAEGCVENDARRYKCEICKAGYVYDRDWPTCLVSDPCTQFPCDDNADCESQGKHARCSCKQGYTGSGAHGDCVVDPCAGNPCDINADCHAEDEGYQCSCKPGYYGSGEKGSCSVDKCVPSPCDEHAGCENTRDGYECTCADGYYGSGEKGQCAGNVCKPFPCKVNEICYDRGDHAECDCREGYAPSGDEGLCMTLECNTSPCDLNAECENTVTGHTCTCHEGYIGTGAMGDCTRDDCALKECGNNEKCHNTSNGAQCSCVVGFVREDVEGECINDHCNPTPCNNNAVCKNTSQGAECKCRDGFVAGKQGECLPPTEVPTEVPSESGGCDKPCHDDGCGKEDCGCSSCNGSQHVRVDVESYIN